MSQERFKDFTGRDSEGYLGRIEDDDYDEMSGPGGASGIGDDPYLGGSTGDPDDVGMHIEPGFSIGDEKPDNFGIDGDLGNRIDGGSYTTLADAADDLPFTETDAETHGSQNALGLETGEDDLSLSRVSGGEVGYDFTGADSDSDLEQDN